MGTNSLGSSHVMPIFNVDECPQFVYGYLWSFVMEIDAKLVSPREPVTFQCLDIRKDFQCTYQEPSFEIQRKGQKIHRPSDCQLVVQSALPD